MTERGEALLRMTGGGKPAPQNDREEKTALPNDRGAAGGMEPLLPPLCKLFFKKGKYPLEIFPIAV